MKHTPNSAALGTALSAAVLGGLIVGTSAGAAAADNTQTLASAELSALTTDFSVNTGPQQTGNGMDIPMKKYTVTAPYGNSSGVHAGRHHNGVDLSAPGTPKIYSATSGKVVYAGSDGGYGNLVKVRTDDGHTLYYAHLSKITVKKGDNVEAGDVLGRQGSTGHSTGPHLHFEVRNKKDKPIDPVKFLGLTNKELTALGR